MGLMSLLVLGILLLVGGYAAADFDARGGGGDEVVMEKEELFGLYEVMGSLLDDPTWAQMHPLPCTDTPWPGVECELLEETSIFFHVTKIHVGEDVVIPPCKPSAKISESLLKLPFLRTLSLMNCFTETPLSLSKTLFHSLFSLEHLTLESNPALSGQIPSTISHLTSLRILSLSQNNLSGQIPKQIGALTNLQHLDLSHNTLSGSIPVQIGNLINLSILDFSYNSLQETVPAASIGRMQSLEKIDLSCNRLQGTLPDDLGNLRKLVLLDVSQNLLSGPIPENLSGLQKLQYLTMEGNPLNSRIPSSIGSLTQLRVLTLSGCGLTGPIPSPLSKLTNLTALSLGNNSLKGTVPPELGSLPNLGTLNLSGNLLTGELLFPRDFMNRVGERLDIRENRGLCSNQELETGNTSARLLQNPTCSSSILLRNKTLAERKPDHKIKPNLNDGGNKSSNGHDSVENMLLIPGIVFLFLLFSLCNFEFYEFSFFL